MRKVVTAPPSGRTDQLEGRLGGPHRKGSPAHAPVSVLSEALVGAAPEGGRFGVSVSTTTAASPSRGVTAGE